MTGFSRHNHMASVTWMCKDWADDVRMNVLPNPTGQNAFECYYWDIAVTDLVVPKEQENKTDAQVAVDSNLSYKSLTRKVVRMVKNSCSLQERCNGIRVKATKSHLSRKYYINAFIFRFNGIFSQKQNKIMWFNQFIELLLLKSFSKYILFQFYKESLVLLAWKYSYSQILLYTNEFYLWFTNSVFMIFKYLGSRKHSFFCVHSALNWKSVCVVLIVGTDIFDCLFLSALTKISSTYC